MIIAKGSDSAPIMFVSDYCMKEDAIHGYALSGSQETTLAGFVSKAGYNLSNCYRTSYIKNILDYDGKGKKQKFLAIKKAFEDAAVKGLDYGKILQDEILAIRPNIIVPLGDLSLKQLCGYSPLNSYRGSVLPLNPFVQASIPEKTVRVIGTFSPRAVWENYTSRVYIQLDFNKIVKLKEQIGPIEIPGQIWVCRTVEAFRNFMARQENWRQRPIDEQFITFDIESYLGIPTAISFSFDGKEALSIPLFETTTDYANSFLLWLEVCKLLASGVAKVNQNIKYDWIILERFGAMVRNIVGDTSLGFHLLYPELPKNLGFQTSIYTDLPYFKDESSKKESAWNPKTYTRDTLYLYNAKDALATWQIHLEQKKEMEESGLSYLYNNKIVPLISIYKDIDQRGLLVHQPTKRKLLGKYKSLLLITATKLKAKLAPVVDIESPEEMISIVKSYMKLGDLIYNKLKYPPRYETTPGGKKNFKTDKDTLDDLMILFGESNKLQEGGRICLNLMIGIKKIIKVIEYIKSPLHPDGTLKTSYNLGGTETGRSSASKTIDQVIEFNEKGKIIWPMKKLGRSLQTITKHGFEIDGEIFEGVGDERLGEDLRSMFVPRPGYCFVEGDLSQAEARAVAVLAEDYDLLRSFDTKPKIHAKTAALIFGVDVNTITKDHPIIPGIGMTYYDLGKRARHAGNYNMGGFRLAQMTHIDKRECDEILIKFHAANPKIRGIFHNDVHAAIKKTQTLRTPHGRIRQFFERLSETTIKEAFAHIPQSTISDQVKFALIPITKRAPWAPVVYEGHDAAMAEVPIGREREWAEIFKEEVEQPINFSNCTLSRDIDLVIPAEIMVGEESWAKMNEIKL